MYYKLPVKERIELMKSYRKANPDMSYQDMVKDYNNSYQKFDNGGKLSYPQNKPQSFFPNPAKISTKVITPATTYVSGKEQNTLSSMPGYKRLLTQAKASAEAQRQYNTSKAILNMASFIPGPIGLGANISSGVVDLTEGDYGQGTLQGAATILRNTPGKKAEAIKGLSDLLTIKELYDFHTQPEPSYGDFLPYLTDEYKRELFKQKPLTVEKDKNVQKFDNGGKKQQTRVDIYTNKAAFDKAYKAEMDSAKLYDLSNKLIRGKFGYPDDYKFPANPKYGRDKDNVLQDYLVKYNPEGIHPDTKEPLGKGLYREEVLKSLERKIKPLGYVFEDFAVPVYKKPVVHNVYQEPEKESNPFVKKWTDKVAYDQAVKAEMDSVNRYNEYINKVKQYQKEGLELQRASFVDKATLNFMNDPAFANNIYSKPIREEYYGNPTKSNNVTSQATALVYKKPLVHNVYEPIMTKPVKASQDTVRHWNFNGPNPVLEYYDKSGKLINKEFYTGVSGKRIQPLTK